MTTNSPRNFKFEIISDDSSYCLHIPSATLSVKRWAKRRDFDITVHDITPRKVVVTTYAPDNRTHNRTVDSLSRMLSKQLRRGEHRALYPVA